MSTRVRSSDHFRDRSTASSSSSRCLQSYFLPFFFFSNKREDKIGENFTRTVSRYIIQDVVSLETGNHVASRFPSV